MKRFLSLCLLILGIVITGFAETPGVNLNEDETFSIVEDGATALTDTVESVKLYYPSYVYFIPINGDMYAVVIEQNKTNSKHKNTNKQEGSFALRERKKWVTHNTKNTKPLNKS